MTDIQWDSQAGLMRVGAFATADTQEELVGRGTLRELVGAVLEMPPEAQRGLLLRAAGPDWSQEFDTDAIRELAARPEFTGATGFFDTAQLGEDPDREELQAPLVTGNGAQGDAVRTPGGAADQGTTPAVGIAEGEKHRPDYDNR